MDGVAERGREEGAAEAAFGGTRQTVHAALSGGRLGQAIAAQSERVCGETRELRSIREGGTLRSPWAVHDACTHRL